MSETDVNLDELHPSLKEQMESDESSIPLSQLAKMLFPIEDTGDVESANEDAADATIPEDLRKNVVSTLLRESLESDKFQKGIIFSGLNSEIMSTEVSHACCLEPIETISRTVFHVSLKSSPVWLENHCLTSDGWPS